MLVESATASALVFELEQWRRLDGRGLKARREAAVKTIAAVCFDLRTGGPKGSTRASIAYMHARAAAENAYGRALYLTGKNPRESLDALETAVALMPTLTDAWVNLAEALMSNPRPPSWQRRAEDALARAHELSPDSEKAHYLRGDLFAKTDRNAEAKAEFEAAKQNPWSTMKLAQLAAREDDWKTAAAQMSRSLNLDRRLDFRARLYVEYLLALARSEPKRLDEAERWAGKLAKDGETPGLKNAGAQFLKKIKAFRRPAAT